jgi:glycosyltransferase involved in cell wall biosynthesis
MFRPCAVVPTYNNPATVRGVVERLRAHLTDVIVVDDGGDAEARSVLAAITRDGLAEVLRRDRNGGKGAAVKDGLRRADSLGFTHALQVDADGQHTLDDAPRLLDAARSNPAALVLGAPVFDASAPSARMRAREITRFWTNVESGGRVIDDPMCGFRVYPVRAALAADARGDAMDFDPEVAVRMVWGGVPVINVPTRVRYVPREEGGVSHFRLGRDNVLISWMHTRLMLLRIGRSLRLVAPPPRLP